MGEDGGRALEGGISFPMSFRGWHPSKWGSGRTVCLWEQLVKKNRMLWAYFKRLFSLLPAKTMRGFLSDLYYENMPGLLKVKSIKVQETSISLSPPRVLTLKLVHTKCPEIHQLHLRFSYPGTGSCGDFCPEISTPLSCDSLYLSVCLSNIGRVVSPVTSLLW